MEAELRSSFPELKIELIRGDGGIFDIRYDDLLIFSKKKTKENRFPEDGEITRLIENEKNSRT
ncbi:MAG: Rdx family protein [Candidatus Krumholzibacteriota bacterium]|nr:Rdx family protein [Candidatus Krumholzibacteriota bacterium]